MIAWALNLFLGPSAYSDFGVSGEYNFVTRQRTVARVGVRSLKSFRCRMYSQASRLSK